MGRQNERGRPLPQVRLESHLTVDAELRLLWDERMKLRFAKDYTLFIIYIIGTSCMLKFYLGTSPNLMIFPGKGKVPNFVMPPLEVFELTQFFFVG